MSETIEIKKKDEGSLKLIFGWVYEYWSRHKLRMLALFLMTALYTALAITYPIFFKLVVDGLRGNVPASELHRNVLFLLALGVGAAVINWTLMSTRGWTNLTIEIGLRERIFSHVTRLGPSFFATYRTGDLITRMTDDLAEKLSWYTCSGVFRAVQGFVLFCFVMIVMIRMNPMLAALTLIPVPFIFVVFRIGEKGFEKRFHKLQKAISMVNDYLEACFSGIRVLKVYNRLDHQKQGFSAVMADRIKAEVKSIKAEGFYNTADGFINQVGVMVVLLAGGYLTIKGRLSLGSFVAFTTYSLMLVEPFWNMGNFFMAGKRAAVSYSRAKELLTAAPEVSDTAVPVPARFEREIAFEQVSYSFGSDKQPVLSGIDFTVAKGQKVAVMGEVGCGKSTLVNLLLRFFDPTAGRVAIDGTDIRQFTLQDLRGLFGYAPQEALLFSETILNNVIFHRDDVDKDRALTASRISQLDKEVRDFAKGFDTLIGQRGLSLSGGQKQRASLARAIVERIASGHPKVLILDDITSALDATTEALVWRELEEKLPKVTCFIVSHRTSTIERAELIVVLKDGKIEEMGTHPELMDRNGYYVTLREREKMQENGNGQNGRNQEGGKLER
ncbi:MAG: ABC transporter ATP-binding protein [Candidatus Edwardsbacteria bacterium]|nr:ABC transporter ATP-binding protein [Candidatus Edwardsbacteria bacterium]